MEISRYVVRSKSGKCTKTLVHDMTDAGHRVSENTNNNARPSQAITTFQSCGDLPSAQVLLTAKVASLLEKGWVVIQNPFSPRLRAMPELVTPGGIALEPVLL